MSTESISQFLSVVSYDSALKEKLASATDSVNFVKIAQASGYNFSLEDLQAYIAQNNNGELSENELEAVAGGARGGIVQAKLSDDFKLEVNTLSPGGHDIPKIQFGPILFNLFKQI